MHVLNIVHDLCGYSSEAQMAYFQMLILAGARQHFEVKVIG